VCAACLHLHSAFCQKSQSHPELAYAPLWTETHWVVGSEMSIAGWWSTSGGGPGPVQQLSTSSCYRESAEVGRYTWHFMWNKTPAWISISTWAIYKHNLRSYIQHGETNNIKLLYNGTYREWDVMCHQRPRRCHNAAWDRYAGRLAMPGWLRWSASFCLSKNRSPQQSQRTQNFLHLGPPFLMWHVHDASMQGNLLVTSTEMYRLCLRTVHRLHGISSTVVTMSSKVNEKMEILTCLQGSTAVDKHAGEYVVIVLVLKLYLKNTFQVLVQLTLLGDAWMSVIQQLAAHSTTHRQNLMILYLCDHFFILSIKRLHCDMSW